MPDIAEAMHDYCDAGMIWIVSGSEKDDTLGAID